MDVQEGQTRPSHLEGHKPLEIAAAHKLAKIRQLNDQLRTTFTGGLVVTTRTFSALCPEVKAEVLSRVRTFCRFTAHNDPHGEHDCGTLKIADRSFIWKIDYYDLQMRYASPDPSDPKLTRRVLTVMCNEDY